MLTFPKKNVSIGNCPGVEVTGTRFSTQHRSIRSGLVFANEFLVVVHPITRLTLTREMAQTTWEYHQRIWN